MKKNKENNKEKENLAYGGMALIEGILMRSKQNYAYVIKKEDGSLHKEKINYIALGKRFKILGLPFIRGIIGFFENMFIGLKVINKSAEIAYPDENGDKISNVTLFFTFIFALLLAMGLFVALPYFLTQLLGIPHNEKPFQYNLFAGIIRMIFFFIYLILISFMKDTKRLFGYHGAEHMTIHTYENEEDLTLENVKKHSRLHPRCGTSFVFIVFLITIIVFPFLNEIIMQQSWYKLLNNYGKPGDIFQKSIIILSHIFIGMPIVASVSYELLKLSGKLHKIFIVKIFILPGLFFQLFTTRKPEDSMIKVGIISLGLVIGNEDLNTQRNINDNINISIKKLNPVVANLILFPVLLINIFNVFFNE